MVVAGYVRAVESFGVFVQFANGLSGMVPRAQIADRFVEGTATSLTNSEFSAIKF